MLTILSTGDRESDLFHWSTLASKQPKVKDIASIDCSSPEGMNKLLRKVETISLLEEEAPVIAHYPELTEELATLLSSYSQDVYILSPTGKLPKLTTGTKVVTDKISDNQLKALLSETLRELNITVTRDDQVRMYLPLTIEDFMGKEKLSPLRCLTFARQLKTIQGSSPEEAQKLLASLIGLSEGKASQWEILSNLFATQKKKQKEYFGALSLSMSPYEIMSMAKSTLLLVLVILAGKQEHLDSASIAGKIGKHPFYVGSLLRTVQEKGITYEKVQKMLVRFFNLESALKSGKFDDEQFGFEVLLATM
jgi:hypothetical protein